MTRASQILKYSGIFLGVAALSGCASSSNQANTTSAASPAAETAQSETVPGSQTIEASSALLQVTGMSCPKCANNITLQLKQVAGVGEVLINMGIGQVIVSFEGEAKPTRDQLASAIDRAGFTLRSITMQ